MVVSQVIPAMLLASVLLLPARCQSGQAWPPVQSLSKEWHIGIVAERGTDTSALAYIRDAKGSPVYKLECHNGDYDDQTEMNFSGDFQCALFAVKNGALMSGNLLAADTENERSSGWWNRGRMRSEQLRGECLKFPEYSSVRHFRLRGMRIALRFTDVRWTARNDSFGGPLLTGFTLTADVVSDPEARSARAELAGGPKPPAACYP